MEFKLWFNSEIWSWETNHILRTSYAIISLLPGQGVLDSIQFSRSVVSDSLLWITVCQASLSFTVSQNLLKLMSVELVMPSNHLILYHPLLLLPSIFPSIRIFSIESVLCIRWPKYRSFSISPSNEYSGLISIRMDWFNLLAVPGTFKGLLQYHSTEASILRSHHFMVNRRENHGNSDRLYFLGLQNHCAVTAVKLKDICSLEEKLWQT